MNGRYSIGDVCNTFGYSRQGYYKRKQIESERNAWYKRIMEHVKEYRALQPRVGGRKLWKMLSKDGIEVGRDQLFNLIRSNGMLVKQKRKAPYTTNSYHRFHKYGNLIREMEVDFSNQVFVSDITYIDTLEGYCYLSLITDMYSRNIVGYYLSDNLSVSSSLKALRMALKSVDRPGELIHHSDRGIQYCSNQYTDYLLKRGVRISMTEKDHVYENAMAERVNGILKQEFMLGERLASKKIANCMVKEAIEIYNNERLHMALGYETPESIYAA